MINFPLSSKKGLGVASPILDARPAAGINTQSDGDRFADIRIVTFYQIRNGKKFRRA